MADQSLNRIEKGATSLTFEPPPKLQGLVDQYGLKEGISQFDSRMGEYMQNLLMHLSDKLVAKQ